MQPQLQPDRTGKKGGAGRAALVILGLALLFSALFATGYIPKLRNRAELAGAAKAAESDLPVVTVVSARRAPASREFVLPGSVEAVQVASIYARASGYLKRRLVDIGDRVRAGQVLAEIESPEVQQELRQAQAAVAQSKAALGQKRAALAQVRANLQLAEVTNNRWKELVAKGVLPRQAGDEKQSALDARKADMEAAEADVSAAGAAISAQEANVQRLQELLGFQKISAPFDGIITARNMEAGDLVTAGSGSTVREIYRLAQLDSLRIFVNVPQAQAPEIRTGQSARVEVQEFPGRSFAGRVTRTANSLDPSSRTLLTEVRVPNTERVVLPGMYAQVTFVSSGRTAGLLIPATVLVIRSDGSHAVAAAGPDDHARYIKIRVGKDYGSETEVLSGLDGNERLIVNPADDLAEGAQVRVVAGRK